MEILAVRCRAERRAARWILIFIVAGFSLLPVSTARQEKQDDYPAQRRGAELLEEARRAAGLNVERMMPRTFSASARSRRFIRYFSVQSPTKVVEKQKTLSGKLEMDFLLPDKFRLRVKGASLSGFGFSFEEIVNGDQAWRNPPMSVRSFNRDQRVIDVGDVERTLLQQARTARQQIAFHSLGWLVTPPGASPFDLSYEGSYTIAGERLEMVIAESREGLRLALLFDPRSKLLTGLMVTYVDTHRDAVIVEVASVDRRFLAATYAAAREERRRRTRPGEHLELLWRFSDHRPVAGILIPHRSTVYFNGALIEENTIEKVRINEPIDPHRFDGRERIRY